MGTQIPCWDVIYKNFVNYRTCHTTNFGYVALFDAYIMGFDPLLESTSLHFFDYIGNKWIDNLFTLRLLIGHTIGAVYDRQKVQRSA